MAEKWMQQAAQNTKERGTKGSFRAYCQRKGFEETTCACVAQGKASNNPLLVKRATLAGNYLQCGKK